MSYPPRLTDAQYRALGGLANNTTDGTCAFNKAALSRLNITKNTCEALESRGLVEILNIPKGPYMRLTDTGYQVLAKADIATHASARATIEEEPYALDDEECQHLLSATTPPNSTSYWKYAPHPVRVRLRAKDMLRPVEDRPGHCEITAAGRTAVTRVVRASMQLSPETPTEELDQQEHDTLYGAVTLTSQGTLGAMDGDDDAVESLVGRGYLRQTSGGHQVTAAGYVFAGHCEDTVRMVELAADDYALLVARRSADHKARRAPLWAWQDRWFFGMSCPPGVDQEIFADLVQELVSLRNLRDGEIERHEQTLQMNNTMQEQVRYRAYHLGLGRKAKRA